MKTEYTTERLNFKIEKGVFEKGRNVKFSFKLLFEILDSNRIDIVFFLSAEHDSNSYIARVAINDVLKSTNGKSIEDQKLIDACLLIINEAISEIENHLYLFDYSLKSPYPFANKEWVWNQIQYFRAGQN